MSTAQAHTGSMSNIQTFLDTYGLLAVFCIMLLKEFGLPVPIPGDLIMLGVAAQAAQGSLSPVLAFAAIFVPMLMGGMVQFTLARGPGRRVIYRLGRLIGLTPARLDRVMERMRRGGTTAVAIGLTTPGLRIATTPASGLADLPARVFLPGLVAGSAFFLGWHFAIGYAGGAALAALNLPAPVLIGIVVGVLALGVTATLIARRRARRRHQYLNASESFANWADASCPVCAALTLAHSARNPDTDLAHIRLP